MEQKDKETEFHFYKSRDDAHLYIPCGLWISLQFYTYRVQIKCFVGLTGVSSLTFRLDYIKNTSEKMSHPTRKFIVSEYKHFQRYSGLTGRLLIRS